MPGPSDVRKNINRLMPCTERSQKSLRSASDYRLPVGILRADALAVIDAILAREFDKLPAPLGSTLPLVTWWQLRRMCAFLETFRGYFFQQESSGRTFNFTDCAIGNLLFAGCYLEQERDFNRTIPVFSELYEYTRRRAAEHHAWRKPVSGGRERE